MTLCWVCKHEDMDGFPFTSLITEETVTLPLDLPWYRKTPDCTLTDQNHGSTRYDQSPPSMRGFSGTTLLTRWVLGWEGSDVYFVVLYVVGEWFRVPRRRGTI